MGAAQAQALYLPSTRTARDLQLFIISREQWTELALPESGAYVVPGALVPIQVDRERDEGVYVEPNVWMVHPPPPATEP